MSVVAVDALIGLNERRFRIHILRSTACVPPPASASDYVPPLVLHHHLAPEIHSRVASIFSSVAPSLAVEVWRLVSQSLDRRWHLVRHQIRCAYEDG